MMQRIVAVDGGVKSYCADPLQVLTAENCCCAFCKTKHRMRRNGRYRRWAIFPGRGNVRICVWRLYCPYARHTLSLLPDFCLPRRQHGPATLAVFLFALVLENRTLAEALILARFDLRRDLARGDVEVASVHSVAQSLRNGFEQKMKSLRTYLCRLHPRMEEAPAGVRGRHQRMAEVMQLLVKGFASLAEALIWHGPRFHLAFKMGLC